MAKKKYSKEESLRSKVNYMKCQKFIEKGLREPEHSEMWTAAVCLMGYMDEKNPFEAMEKPYKPHRQAYAMLCALWLTGNKQGVGKRFYNNREGSGKDVMEAIDTLSPLHPEVTSHIGDREGRVNALIEMAKNNIGIQLKCLADVNEYFVGDAGFIDWLSEVRVGEKIDKTSPTYRFISQYTIRANKTKQ